MYRLIFKFDNRSFFNLFCTDLLIVGKSVIGIESFLFRNSVQNIVSSFHVCYDVKYEKESFYTWLEVTSMPKGRKSSYSMLRKLQNSASNSVQSMMRKVYGYRFYFFICRIYAKVASSPFSASIFSRKCNRLAVFLCIGLPRFMPIRK